MLEQVKLSVSMSTFLYLINHLVADISSISKLFQHTTQNNICLRGLLLNTPVIKLQTFGCFPTLNSSIESWNAEMLDLCVLIALYSKPT